MAQQVQEQQVGVLCGENGLAAVATGHHMIDGPPYLSLKGLAMQQFYQKFRTSQEVRFEWP